MKRLLIITFIMALTLSFFAVCSAQITNFIDNPSEFATATQGLTFSLINFDSLTEGQFITTEFDSKNVRFINDNLGLGIVTSSNIGGQPPYSAPLGAWAELPQSGPVPPTKFTFKFFQPVRALSFWLIDQQIPGAVMYVFDNNNNVLATTSLDPFKQPHHFIAVVSNLENIASIAVRANIDGLGFDNIRIFPEAYPSQTDSDNDGIQDDGDNSGIVGDNPCSGGETQNCDDNCPYDKNQNQEDSDSDKIGDVCDSGDFDPTVRIKACSNEMGCALAIQSLIPFYGKIPDAAGVANTWCQASYDMSEGNYILGIGGFIIAIFDALDPGPSIGGFLDCIELAMDKWYDEIIEAGGNLWETTKEGLISLADYLGRLTSRTIPNFDWKNLFWDLHFFHCPVEIKVVDENGKWAGFDENGQHFSNMDNPSFILKFGEDKKLVVMLGEKDKTYKIQISASGASEGSKFGMINFKRDSDSLTTLYFEEVSIGPNSKCEIDSDFGNINVLLIDYDGDGSFEENLGPTSVEKTYYSDLDNDGYVDCNDYLTFSSIFGLCSTDSNYLSDADLDEDGCITKFDRDILFPSCLKACNLACRSKLSKIQLTWTHVGADSYNIYRKAEGEEYSLLANTTSTYSTCLDSNVTIGNTYYYIVKSVCNNTEGETSNEVSITLTNRRTR